MAKVCLLTPGQTHLNLADQDKLFIIGFPLCPLARRGSKEKAIKVPDKFLSLRIRSRPASRSLSISIAAQGTRLCAM